MDAPLHCWVYRGDREAELYLYLPAPGAFEAVPEEVMQALGEPALVLELDLHAGQRLARADAAHVLRELRERGFYLQMPPRWTPRLRTGD